MDFQSFIEGFMTNLGLIVAIGPQNAYLIRQGLTRQSVLPAILFFIITDVIVILIGVQKIGTFISDHQYIYDFMKWSGIIFLIGYALLSFKNAIRLHKKFHGLDDISHNQHHNLMKILLISAGVTFLNPNMVLDTILLGSIASSYTEVGRACYAYGAIVVSVLWFMLVGYGARFLSPFFTSPRTWQYLDILVGIIMLIIALILFLKF